MDTGFRRYDDYLASITLSFALPSVVGSSDGKKGKSTLRAKKNRENKAPSFPRRRESSVFTPGRSHWIPAFVGMTRKIKKMPEPPTPLEPGPPFAPAGDSVLAAGCAGRDSQRSIDKAGRRINACP